MKSQSKKLLAIRIRGQIDLKYNIKKTLQNMGLKRKFSAKLLEDNEMNRKLLRKVKDYITFGEANEATIKAFKMNLHPPIGGFKKSTLANYPRGELGYRKEEINALYGRMLK